MWRTRDLIIVLIVSVTLLATLEWLARKALLNQLPDDEYSARALAIHNHQNTKDKLVYSKIDPLLGWGGNREPVFNESVVVLKSKFNRPKKVLILGGSTSDMHFHPKNWPFYLARLFEREGQAVDIHVGATGGYDSHQELLKIIRDARLISYDVILSYTGVNEAVDRHNKHPFTPLHTQYFLYRAIPPSKLFLGISGLIQNWFSPLELTFGPEDTLSVAQRFITNIKSAHAISEVYGAKYFTVLQPYLTSGQRSLSQNEKKLLNNLFTKDLVETNKRLYAHVKKIMDDRNYFYDGTRFLDPLKEAYHDDCHTNDEGNKLIARKIYQLMNDQNLL